jgi:hypothetical protein
LAKVRSENRIGRDLVIPKEPIGALELSVIKRLGEALTGPLGESLSQQAQPLTQPRIAEISISKLARQLRGTYLA